MWLQRLFICFIALLFASQTVSAIIDEHSVHKNIETHLSSDVNHQHQSDKVNKQNSELDSNTEEQFNCHDCGHCHTPANIYLFTSVTQLNLSKNSHDDTLTYVAVASYLISPEHRPPIA